MDRITAEDFGSKAHHLARLTALGVDVPPAVCVHRQAFVDVVGGDDAAGIAAALAALDAVGVDDEVALAAACGAASDAIIGIVARLTPDPTLRAALTSAAAMLGGRLIVRSSAIGEDGAHASFAGQLDSFADIDSADGDAVVDAVVRVWASAASARSLHYQRRRGERLRGVAVILQRYVAAHASGVLFTCSPHDAAQVWGEYCFGPGEALVGGKVTPGAFSAPRARRAERHLPIARHGRPDENETEDNRRDLDDDALRALVGCGHDIEAAFGAPQDIEWCLDHDGRLWIVQARPITTTTTTTTTTTVATTSPPRALRRLQRFSNANVNENFPEPLSPLLYSIVQKGYRAYFRALGEHMGLDEERLRAAEPALSAIVGAHGGRLYYNLSSLHGCLQVAPFGDWLTSSFNLFVGVDGGVAESAAFRARKSVVVEAAAAARFVGRATLALSRAGERLPGFEADVDAFARDAHPTLVPHLGDDALLALLRRFLWIRTERWTPAAMGDVSALMGYGLLRSFIRARHPDAPETLPQELLKGLADVVSGVPTQRLWELAVAKRRGDADYATQLAFFLETWGFRRSGELSLTAPTFQEDPAPVLALIDQYASELAGDDDALGPAARTAGHARAREQATDALLGQTPLPLRPVLRGLVALAKHGIGLRERARLKQALLYTRLGPVVRELGHRLARDGVIHRADDVFMFTVDELIDQLSGSAMFGAFAADHCAERRRRHERLVAMQPDETFTLPQGHYLAATARTPAATTTPRSSSSSTLVGAPAAGGRARGPAAVLADVAEAARMRRGDVLVTRQTDPGWGPVLFLAKALVIERGGMLSHGAIIAREFGVPCVVGLAGASRLIEHGMIVDVDGDAGTVRLEPGSAS